MNTDRIVRIHGDAAEVVYSDGTHILIGDTTAGQTGDGFHSLDDLYRHRTLLTAALLNTWTATYGSRRSYKTWQHHPDDSTPMFPGMFKVGATLPTGEITYHVNADAWDLFHIPERPHSPLWDGHTADDVVARLEAFLES